MTTKRDIIQAGVRVAKERGDFNFTCGEVATEAGVSRTLMYYYFCNSRDLQLHVIFEVRNTNTLDEVIETLKNKITQQ